MSSLLELLAGLALICFLLSMLSSSMDEIFQTRIKSWSKQLYDAISKVLLYKTDQNRADLFHHHPLIAQSIEAILERNEAILRSMESKELSLGRITEVEGRITWQQFREFTCKNLEACSFQTLIGWLVAAPLLRQGAPFWFEMLKKLVTLRGTVAKSKAAAS
jgi:hypothetical protein